MKRYKLYRGGMHEDEKGKYVLFDDVKTILENCMPVSIEDKRLTPSEELAVYGVNIDKINEDYQILVSECCGADIDDSNNEPACSLCRSYCKEVNLNDYSGFNSFAPEELKQIEQDRQDTENMEEEMIEIIENRR
jgi:hypothetical protein